MHEVWNEMMTWIAEGRHFAMARVLEAWGSGPRRPGATMLVDAQRNLAGSVSGGCIEAAVVDAAASVATGELARRMTFGVENEQAWSLGLSCGGTITVFVEPHMLESSRAEDRATWAAIEQAHDEHEPIVVLTRTDPDRVVHAALRADGRLVGATSDVPEALLTKAATALETGRTCTHETPEGCWFLHVLPRSDRLVIIGAGHVTVHLVALAHELGIETAVIDPREVFANAVRFPVPPDRLLVEWPEPALDRLGLHRDTYAVLLTHDPKIDDPALHRILRSDARYVGALGSRRTHEARRARLAKAGFSPDEIDRVRGPVGLDIGATSPAEIALSILAEVVAVKRGRGRVS